MIVGERKRFAIESHISIPDKNLSIIGIGYF